VNINRKVRDRDSETEPFTPRIATFNFCPILESARNISINEQIAVLVVYGPIPRAGYPLPEHKSVVTLAMLTQTDTVATSGVYRVMQRDGLSEMLDDLEDHGGYRCSLIEPSGEVNQGYFL